MALAAVGDDGGVLRVVIYLVVVVVDCVVSVLGLDLFVAALVLAAAVPRYSNWSLAVALEKTTTRKVGHWNV